MILCAHENKQTSTAFAAWFIQRNETVRNANTRVEGTTNKSRDDPFDANTASDWKLLTNYIKNDADEFFFFS